MGLLDFIKNIFKPKPKMLEEPKKDSVASDWRQAQQLPYTPKVDVTSQEQGNNPQLETILINKLKKDEAYQIDEQKNSNDNSISFYHISKNNCSMGSIPLYINCKQRNIAMIVDEILTGMENDGIYLKFIANEYVNKALINDSIVIYTTDEDVSKIENVINKISIQKPELFEGSNRSTINNLDDRQI